MSSWFDPLLAKVIAWGETREASISLMCEALDKTRISGVKTNTPTLIKTIESAEFVRGKYTTDLLTSLLRP